jgi:hypothetical protein
MFMIYIIGNGRNQDSLYAMLENLGLEDFRLQQLWLNVVMLMVL